ncbi:unnamed protein product [Heligmosomoides polygyrus]|uniref:Flocculation protein FLO11-like n=1 Tax=Heligmosomoides polygyrus TaxID=6339 RepID=A0A183FTU5_HELPZ|nr:unnamed protein product [Heligmosomoides polygyrus]
MRVVDCHVPTVLITFQNGGAYQRIFGKLYNEGDTGESMERGRGSQKHRSYHSYEYSPLPLLTDYGNVKSHLSGTYLEGAPRYKGRHDWIDQRERRKNRKRLPWYFEKAKVLQTLRETSIVPQAPPEASINARAEPSTVNPVRIESAKIGLQDNADDGESDEEDLQGTHYPPEEFDSREDGERTPSHTAPLDRWRSPDSTGTRSETISLAPAPSRPGHQPAAEKWLQLAQLLPERTDKKKGTSKPTTDVTQTMTTTTRAVGQPRSSAYTSSSTKTTTSSQKSSSQPVERVSQTSTLKTSNHSQLMDRKQTSFTPPPTTTQNYYVQAVVPCQNTAVGSSNLRVAETETESDRNVVITSTLSTSRSVPSSYDLPSDPPYTTTTPAQITSPQEEASRSTLPTTVHYERPSGYPPATMATNSDVAVATKSSLASVPQEQVNSSFTTASITTTPTPAERTLPQQPYYHQTTPITTPFERLPNITKVTTPTFSTPTSSPTSTRLEHLHDITMVTSTTSTPTSTRSERLLDNAKVPVPPPTPAPTPHASEEQPTTANITSSPPSAPLYQFLQQPLKGDKDAKTATLSFDGQQLPVMIVGALPQLEISSPQDGMPPYSPVQRTYAISSPLRSITGPSTDQIFYNLKTPYGTVFFEKSPAVMSVIRSYNGPSDSQSL